MFLRKNPSDLVFFFHRSGKIRQLISCFYLKKVSPCRWRKSYNEGEFGNYFASAMFQEITWTCTSVRTASNLICYTHKKICKHKTFIAEYMRKVLLDSVVISATVASELKLNHMYFSKYWYFYNRNWSLTIWQNLSYRWYWKV